VVFLTESVGFDADFGNLRVLQMRDRLSEMSVPWMRDKRWSSRSKWERRWKRLMISDC